MSSINNQTLQPYATSLSADTKGPTTPASVTQQLQALQTALKSSDGLDPQTASTLNQDVSNLMGTLSDPNYQQSPAFQQDLSQLLTDLTKALGGSGAGGSGGGAGGAGGAGGGGSAGSAGGGSSAGRSSGGGGVAPQDAPPTSSSSSTGGGAGLTGAGASAYASGMTGPEATQWNAMYNNEASALRSEGSTRLATTQANYAQAQPPIKADPKSAYASSAQQVLSDPMASAAEKQMAANFPATGSMDLTQDQINQIYGPAISAASQKTGVPQNVISNIIDIESKGHPLASNGGLMQIDDVQWGMMKDKDPSLTNRYNPADNIMAGAMDLVAKAGGSAPTTDAGWMSVYNAAYKG